MRTALKFRKRKNIRHRLFTSSIKFAIRHFHVVIVQGRQRNVQKSVMHVQSCCLLNKPIAFLRSPSSLLKLPKIEHKLTLKWRILRICWITNLRSRHQEVSSIRACLSFHRLHYDWRVQYCDARDQYFFFTGRQRRFPASTVARK